MKKSSALLILLIASLVYVFLVASQLSIAYIDFGDGNYLYIAKRVTEGLTLYKDIMAPQPPCHLITGVLLIKLGGALGHVLYTVRWFSILLHIATMFLVYAIGLRLFEDRTKAVMAGTIALFLPVGFVWAMGYQSEPLEMLFMLSAFLCFIRLDAKGALFAGLFAALGTLTNMTAAPYALFNLGYLAVRRPKLALFYALSFFGLYLSVSVVTELWTGAFFNNVIFNQVGSYPQEGFLAYAFGKVVNEGAEVFQLEGGFIIFAVVGITLFLRTSRHEAKEYTAWYAFFSLLSILYVSKGGTMDYIFTIGEPFVALFAAVTIVDGLRKESGIFSGGKTLLRDTLPLARIVLLLFLGAIMCFIGFFQIVNTLKGYNYDLDEQRTAMVLDYMDAYTEKGDEILAHPYYAFISGRRLVEDYSEVLLWTIKYYNERNAGIEEEGVRKIKTIAGKIHDRSIPLLILDMRQTGKIPEIKEAVEANYRPLHLPNLNDARDATEKTIDFYTRDFWLRFYVPKEKKKS